MWLCSERFMLFMATLHQFNVLYRGEFFGHNVIFHKSAPNAVVILYML